MEITTKANNNPSFLILPDTSHQEGDTIAIYTSGGDSTFVTYSEPLPDSMTEGWVINYPDTRMIVELSYHDAPVNEDVIGINLTDFFEAGHANVDDNDNYSAIQDPWKDLVDLAPKTIRVFSGSGGKFMHPLGYYVDDPLDEDYDVTYGGYGFNWKELVGFYDRTGPGSPPVSFPSSSYIYKHAYR